MYSPFRLQIASDPHRYPLAGLRFRGSNGVQRDCLSYRPARFQGWIGPRRYLGSYRIGVRYGRNSTESFQGVCAGCELFVVPGRPGPSVLGLLCSSNVVAQLP